MRLSRMLGTGCADCKKGPRTQSLKVSKLQDLLNLIQIFRQDLSTTDSLRVDAASIYLSQWGKLITWCCKHLTAAAEPYEQHMETNAMKMH